MNTSVRVIDPDEDVAREPPNPHRRLPFPLLAAGAVLAFLVGFVAGSGTGQAPEAGAPSDSEVVETRSSSSTAPLVAPGERDGTTSPTTEAPAATTTTLPPRLSERVPEFTGTLTFVGADSAAVWRPAARAPRSIPGLTSPIGVLAFNAGATRIAYLSGQPERQALYVGTEGQIEPVALDVASFAWHPTDRNRLAWIGSREVGGEERWLFVADVVTGQTEAIVELTQPEGHEHTGWWISEWGEWGFAVQRSSWSSDGSWQDASLVIAADGSVRLERSGTWLLGASPTGVLAFGDPTETVILMSNSLEIMGELDAGVGRLSFSADGTRVAYRAGSGDLTVVNLDTMTPQAFDLDADPIGFTEDGRHLVGHAADRATGRGPIGIVDLATGDVYLVDFEGGFWPAGVR